MAEVATGAKKQNPAWTLAKEETSPVNLHHRLGLHSHRWRPPTDVYETEEAILIKVEIAGMREMDFSIILDDRTLSIQGTRQDLEAKRAYHQMEIRNGEFSTEVALHWPVETEAVEAEYRDGFLRIVLPKEKPHPIIVEG